MADTTNYDIPIETWVQVTTGATVATFYRKNAWYDYYRVASTLAPAAITGGQVPDLAVPMFEKSERDIMLSDSSVNVYVCCFPKDKAITDGGKISVDY